MKEQSRVRLSKQEQQELRRLLQSGLQPVRTVLRALALRQLAEGQTVRQVAKNVALTPKTVWLISQRFRQGGLERALSERPRPGQAAVLQQERRSPKAMRPGHVAGRDGECQRGGQAIAVGAGETIGGRDVHRVADTRPSREFADYLLEVAIRCPEADTVHLLLGNRSS